MRVLLLGANGQLGSDIARLWRDSATTLACATRADADVTDAEAIRSLVQAHRPDVVINTTAFHNMPAAEVDPATCFHVNVTGAWNVARAAVEAGARTIQVSTDYVFDGTKKSPYVETDARRALNVYGAAKIATEDVVRIVDPRALVVRVSGLYGLAGSSGKGGNFVETMFRLARDEKPVRVVADQLTAPTNTADIAEALLPLVREGTEGVAHVAASEGCSWFEFAAAIFRIARLQPDFAPTTAAEFGGPVTRPAYSVLGTTRPISMPGWRAGLERYMHEKHGL